MHKKYFAIAAALGGLAVMIGAFGAHGLEKLTTDEKIIHGFQTGAQYQMYHALAMLIIAGLFDRLPANRAGWAFNSFATGILLFSGSLYLLSFLKIQDSAAVKFIGPLTPLGGVFFIGGWLLLLMAALKKNPS